MTRNHNNVTCQKSARCTDKRTRIYLSEKNERENLKQMEKDDCLAPSGKCFF